MIDNKFGFGDAFNLYLYKLNVIRCDDGYDRCNFRFDLFFLVLVSF